MVKYFGKEVIVMIFDTHAHYDDKAFDDDRAELLFSMGEQGIEKIVNIGSSFEANEVTRKLTEQYAFIKAAFGIHPEFAAELNEENFKRIEELCRLKCCVAVGEIGLDYYWPEPGADVQKPWFERQMDLGKRIGKPMVIHSRDAAQDTYEMMKAADAGMVGGVVHCFSYGKEMARQFVDMGFFIGVGGVVTFKNGRKLKSAPFIWNKNC